jgi:hypothetical protein
MLNHYKAMILAVPIFWHHSRHLPRRM